MIGVRDTLRLMNRPDEPYAVARARDCAAGAAESARCRIDRSLGTQLRDRDRGDRAETGDAMAREQVEVPVKEQVLTSLGRRPPACARSWASRLHRFRRFDAAAAARDHFVARSAPRVLARARSRIVWSRDGAIPHLKRAIELDPDFAMAQALLSGVYANTGQIALTPGIRAAGVRAARPGQRTGAVFYLVALLPRRDAGLGHVLELARTWTATYPREPLRSTACGRSQRPGPARSGHRATASRRPARPELCRARGEPGGRSPR